MLQILIDFFSFLPKEAMVLVLASMPVSELRGAIPLGLGLGLSVKTTVLLAIIGNLIPIPVILLFLGPISEWLMKKHRVFQKFFDWLFARTRRRGKSIEKYEALGLVFFVAIPLPMTGAWTGSMAAFLLGIKFWRAFICVIIGVLIAAGVVTLVSMGAINLGTMASKLFIAH